jgi:ADP-ribose pyrophosphatase YjhB (NUDIX family)
MGPRYSPTSGELEPMAVPASRSAILPSIIHRRTAVTAAPTGDVLTSGGILWRIGAAGEIEVCLTRTADGWTLPRGRVQEDERLKDAAVRQVLTATGFSGRAGRALERIRIGGEIAHLFLLRCGRASRSLFHDSARSKWVDAGAAAAMVSTGGERDALERARELLEARQRLDEAFADVPGR